MICQGVLLQVPRYWDNAFSNFQFNLGLQTVSSHKVCKWGLQMGSTNMVLKLVLANGSPFTGFCERAVNGVFRLGPQPGSVSGIHKQDPQSDWWRGSHEQSAHVGEFPFQNWHWPSFLMSLQFKMLLCMTPLSYQLENSYYNHAYWILML